MAEIRSRARLASVLTPLVLTGGLLAVGLSAQIAVPRNPQSFALTPTRLAAFVAARAQRTNYVPGDVVIKFRSGVTRTGQQRALMALRSRPSVDALQWKREVATLHDDSQPDAQVLATTLAR